MWKKILKYRDKTKNLYRVEVGNGEKASFWYESWSPLGCLNEFLSYRGCIDMGILAEARVADCVNYRRRHHRFQKLNDIEEKIERVKSRMHQDVEDVSLWRTVSGKFKRNFSTRETWQITRENTVSTNGTRVFGSRMRHQSTRS